MRKTRRNSRAVTRAGHSPNGKAKNQRRKTADEVAVEQGIQPLTDADLDGMIGKGKDLWKSDREFDEFVAGIYERRRQSRGS